MKLRSGKAGLAAIVLVLVPLMARTGNGLELAAAIPAADQPAAVDINSAGKEDLRTLPGIGPARAQAIIAGRPYFGTDDLVKRNILPRNVYDGVKDRIIARQK